MSDNNKITKESLLEDLSKNGFETFFGVNKEFRYLAKALARNENVLAGVSGLMNGNTILCVLTNRQVWLIDHGLVFGVRTSTIPLEKINQVSYQRHMFFGDVEITNGADVTELRNVEKNSAQHFVQFINDYLANLYHEDHYQQSGIGDRMPSGSSDSVADELLKFKKLYDDGVISHSEFLEQKNKLLHGNHDEDPSKRNNDNDSSSKPEDHTVNNNDDQLNSRGNQYNNNRNNHPGIGI